MTASAHDFLFEIGTEELPPKHVEKLAAHLAEFFTSGLKESGLNFEKYRYFATPRRLAVLVYGLALRQSDQTIEKRGPALAAAYDSEGNPSKALLGFARSCGVEAHELSTVDTDKGPWIIFSKTEAGQNASALLPAIAEKAIQLLPIAKRMHWGTQKISFVRPVHWIVFMHGPNLVPCTLLGKAAGKLSYGHRFHHPDAIVINTPDDYENTLERVGGVIADFAKRKAQIKQQALQIAREDQTVIIHESLLDEVTGLVEQPHVLLGKFDPSFLKVPQEALMSAMQEHQKYFPIVDRDGVLQPCFVITANINSTHPEHVIAGNEKVIRPRLADAKFFYETDGKHTLTAKNALLKTIIFQDKLGTLYEKAERNSALARKIAAKIGANPDVAARAALLAKADLASAMVGEFPDLQGTMGYYYALNDGESIDVALAIKQHYQPKFSGDQLPDTLAGLAVALADKLDSMVGIFAIGQIPSGDKDPFALRRSALGIIRIIIDKALPLDLADMIDDSIALYQDKVTQPSTRENVLDFILARFRAHYKEQGVATEIIQSVENLKPTRPLDFEKRIRAVEQFIALPEAQALSAANKRVQNILKKQDSTPNTGTLNPALLIENAEKKLAEKIQAKENRLKPLFAAGNYSDALLLLADLKDEVDPFFDQVMVMVEDEALRNNRLLLLTKLRNLFLHVADISVLSN